MQTLFIGMYFIIFIVPFYSFSMQFYLQTSSKTLFFYIQNTAQFCALFISYQLYIYTIGNKFVHEYDNLDLCLLQFYCYSILFYCSVIEFFFLFSIYCFIELKSRNLPCKPKFIENIIGFQQIIPKPNMCTQCYRNWPYEIQYKVT